MTLHEFNNLPADELKRELFTCCGSTAWVNRMIPFFPMDDLVELMEDAEEQWYLLSELDWKEAFTHHPKIGERESITTKFAGTAQWASGEQSGVNTAPPQVLTDLALANTAYENKFGYIFIVCATGKTAEEMLTLLQQRLVNSPETEIIISMEELIKITLIRLQKLLS